MVRQVRGLGTLVPEEIRWIAARTQGRVDKIILRPGATVDARQPHPHARNPDVVSAAANAESQLKAAEAQLASQRMTLESQLLQAEAVAARAKSNFETTKLRAEVQEELFRDGLVSALDLKLAQATAADGATNNESSRSATPSPRIPSSPSSP
jgi:HlyD family secretion protein